jgi:hypothetical protein
MTQPLNQSDSSLIRSGCHEQFRGSLRVVTEWATRRRQAENANAHNLQRIPSARTIAQLMTTSRDTLSKSETVTVAAIEDRVPLLVEAREVIAEFHAMIKRKSYGATIKDALTALWEASDRVWSYAGNWVMTG